MDFVAHNQKKRYNMRIIIIDEDINGAHGQKRVKKFTIYIYYGELA